MPEPGSSEDYAAAIDADEKKMGADRQKPQPEIRVAPMLRRNVLVPVSGRAVVRRGAAGRGRRLSQQADHPDRAVSGRGGVDVIGRIVADKLAAELGQPVVNRQPGRRSRRDRHPGRGPRGA